MTRAARESRLVLAQRRRFTSAVWLAALIAVNITGHRADAQAPAVSAPGQRLVAGRVVDAVTGGPVAGATVSYTAVAARYVPGTSGPVASRGTIETDDEGMFVVTANDAIGMHVSAAADGYLPGAFGQRWPGGPDAMFRLPQDRQVVIPLWKYASIGGAATYSDGAPVEGVNVEAFRLPFTAGDAFSALTDSEGRYTIDGLPPGMYKVATVLTYSTTPAAVADVLDRDDAEAATLRAELARSDALIPETEGVRSGTVVLHLPGGLPEADAGAVVYPTQFFPGSPTPNEASMLRLTAGEERQHVDFRLAPVPAARVSGVVSSPSGPPPHVGVSLVMADSALPLAARTAAFAVTNARGEFTILGVAPGQYELRALQRGDPDPPATLPARVPGTFSNDLTASLRGSIPVTVDGSSAEDVRLSLSPGPVVTGVIEVRAAGGRTMSSLPRTLVLEPVDRRMSTVLIAVAADGTFRTNGAAPGDYVLTLPRDSEWAMSSAMVDGRDMSAEPLSIDAGEHVVTVTVTDQPSALSVSVTATIADAPVTLFIFPARSDARGPGAAFREVNVTGPAANVREVLPPGAYLLVAVGEGTFDTDWREPEPLERLARLAASATVRAGQTTQVTVRAVDLR